MQAVEFGTIKNIYIKKSELEILVLLFCFYLLLSIRFLWIFKAENNIS